MPPLNILKGDRDSTQLAPTAHCDPQKVRHKPHHIFFLQLSATVLHLIHLQHTLQQGPSDHFGIPSRLYGLLSSRIGGNLTSTFQMATLFLGNDTLRQEEVSQRSQHGHVRDAEGRSAGLPLTLNIPPCKRGCADVIFLSQMKMSHHERV